MITEDSILKLRLGAERELLARLGEFVLSYRLADRPALILQARPVVPLTGATKATGVSKKLAEGGAEKHAWWQGFRSATAVRPVFHGLAALSAREAPTWASEYHRDGHFIAGVWDFPSFNHSGMEVSAIADFYGDAFHDFFSVVRNTAGPSNSDYDFTATLCNADRIFYAGQADYGRMHVIRHTPLAMQHLQWPVVRVKMSDPAYEQAAHDMSEALSSAYGHTRTPA